MQNSLTPDYLSSLAPDNVGNNSAYNLRNARNLNTIQAHSQLLQDLNGISEEIRNLPGLSSFKRHLDSGLIASPKIFFDGKRLGQIYHARLRMRCSALNAHLFSKNIIDSPLCVCGSFEDAQLFLFSCTRYTILRQELVNKVTLVCHLSSHLSSLTLEVVGTPQMTLQQYLSILPCLPLPTGKPHSRRFLDVIFPSLLLAHFTVLCRIVFAMPQDLEMWPYHLSFRFFTMVRRSSCTPIAVWILLQTSSQQNPECNWSAWWSPNHDTYSLLIGKCVHNWNALWITVQVINIKCKVSVNECELVLWSKNESHPNLSMTIGWTIVYIVYLSTYYVQVLFPHPRGADTDLSKIFKQMAYFVTNFCLSRWFV